MLASARKIIRKRVGPQGIEIDCEDDQEKWVDIKETTRAIYERARGFKYQKTVYNHINQSNRRAYEDEPKITFKNPENENQTIEYLKTKGANHGVIKHLWVEAGRGRFYRKTKVHFSNTEDNQTRLTREQRVENPDTGDYLIVERIKRFTSDWGRGQAYQKKKVHPLHTEEQIEEMEGPCKVIS